MNTLPASFFVILWIVNFKISELKHIIDYEDYETKYGEVIQVSMLLRHGDRTPLTSYPTDPHKTYPWPDGLRQLTTKGKQRMYYLGKWFRQRYSELAKKIKSHTNMSAWSSSEDRAIMSAECFLAGFYEPPATEYIVKGLPWQPVPIYTIPVRHDNIIQVNYKRKCAAVNYFSNVFYRRKSVKKIYDKYNETFSYLQNHTGYIYPRNNIELSMAHLRTVFGTILAQKENGLEQPEWTYRVFPNPLQTIHEALSYKFIESSTKMKRLLAGPFLKSVILNLIEKARYNSSKIFHFYFGHDIILNYVAIALNFTKSVVIPYGSSLTFELRRKGNQHTVLVLYSNSSLEAPYLLPIPHCTSGCSLDGFIQAVDRFIPDCWETECQLSRTKNLYRKYDKILRRLHK